MGRAALLSNEKRIRKNCYEIQWMDCRILVMAERKHGNYYAGLHNSTKCALTQVEVKPKNLS